MRIETVFTLDADEKVVDVKGWEHLIQIAPTECYIKGDKSQRGKGHPMRTSYWTLAAEQTNEVSINSQVGYLVDTLEPKAQIIRSLIDEFTLDCGIASFVWLEEGEDLDDLDLYVDAATISKMAKLNADFAIRVYDYLK